MSYFKAGSLIELLTSTATAAGTTTLVYTSTPLQQFTGTTTQTVVMPDATTMNIGQKFIILNRSTEIVTVQDGAASTLLAIPGNNQSIFTLTTKSTTAGTWDAGSIFSLNGLTATTQTFSTGTSGTDFGISSSGSAHTFNLPSSSASNRGLLTSANWTTFNDAATATTAATSANTANAIVKRGASGEFSSGTHTVTGNVTATGDIGVGTTSPSGPLHIVQDSGDGSTVTYHDVYTGSPFSVYRRAQGTVAAPSAVNASGTLLGGFGTMGYGATAFPAETTGAITSYSEGAFTDSSMPTSLRFETTPSGSITRSERMRIDSAGNVGIGITPTYKLHVDGGMIVGTYSVTDVTQKNSILDSLTVTSTANGTHTGYGLQSIITPVIASGVTNSGALFGGYFQARRNSASDLGTLTNLRGIEFVYGHQTGLDAGAVTSNVYGVSILPYKQAGTITNHRALNIEAASGGGTITNDYAIYQASTTAYNYLGGRTAIGTTTNPASNALRIGGDFSSSGTSQTSISLRSVFTSNATVGGYGLDISNSTTAAAYTMADMYNIFVANPTVGSGSSITRNYGLYLANQAAGATNYAIYSAGGQSVHAGNLRLGSTTAPTVALDVTGSAAISSALDVSGLAKVKTENQFPLNVFRDATAGLSTNTVEFQVGNGSAGGQSTQGTARMFYTNAAATGSPAGGLEFVPRNNADNGSSQMGYLQFTKTAAANTAAIALKNTAGGIDIDSAGKVGIGTASPTAVLHLKAGTATANTAPLKFTSGTNLTTPEAGVMEYDGAKFYLTDAAGDRARVNRSYSTVLPSNITPPGTGVAYQNATDYDADVIVSGGTVTNIEFSRDNSTWYTVGLTAGMIRLSPNDYMRVTYSSAPTMTLVPR